MGLRKKLKHLLPASYAFKRRLRELDELSAELEKKRPPDTLEAEEAGLRQDYYCQHSDLWQERRSLITENYRRLIYRLSMPMPDSSDPKFWARIENQITRQSVWCLSSAGEHAAIDIIREAKRHRREALTVWCTSLTGLGGTLIGVLSMLKVFG